MIDDKARKMAAEYSAKYNDMDLGGFDPEEFDYQNEGPKYSCDGCRQNIKALYFAFLAGYEAGHNDDANYRLGFERGSKGEKS